jgi:hypothetical protein
VSSACRILDNLPLVVPIKRMDKDEPTVYQHGVHVGVKGQYSGVSSELLMLCIFASVMCKPQLQM